MYLILLSLFILISDAHVRLLYSDEEFELGNRPIRNANAATTDGRASVNGPCGGNQAFGANGVSNASPNDKILIKFNYGADHDSPNNLLTVRFKCGAPSQDDLKADSTDQTCVSKRCPTPGAYPCPATDAQIDGGYVFECTVPSDAVGECTYSVVDQRDWGGCLDMKIAASVDPNQPPPPVTITDLLGFYGTAIDFDEGSALKEGCCCKVVNGFLRIDQENINSGGEAGTSGNGFLSGKLNFQCPDGSRFSEAGLTKEGFTFEPASTSILIEKKNKDVNFRGTGIIFKDFNFEFVVAKGLIQLQYNNPERSQLICDATIKYTGDVNGNPPPVQNTQAPDFSVCPSEFLECSDKKLTGTTCDDLVAAVGCYGEVDTTTGVKSSVMKTCCATCDSTASLFVGLIGFLLLLLA